MTTAKRRVDPVMKVSARLFTLPCGCDYSWRQRADEGGVVLRADWSRLCTLHNREFRLEWVEVHKTEKGSKTV